jgi:hypothetical protein
MHKLEVGKLYNPNRRRWLEGVQYSYRGDQHELVLFFEGPTAREVEAVRRGTSEFALTVAPPLVVLCYRFGDGIPWSDAPFTYHLVPESERSLPPEVEEGAATRACLLVFLVDAGTGILRVIRQVSFSNAFTARLHRAIREQALSTWDKSGYDRALAGLYRRHSAQDLASMAQVRCSGGD